MSSFVMSDNLMTGQTLNANVSSFTNRFGFGASDHGNTAISINIGSFKFTNNAFNSIIPSSLVSLFTTQVETITMGNTTSPIQIGAFQR